MPLPSIKNRVGMSVSGTPGTGPITLNAADTGYQSFATAYGANANVDVLIIDGTAWEVARDCTYTHSGTTLSRGTLEDSSTGSALSLTSAAKVYVTETASRIGRSQLLDQAITPGGRLTLESGVPVSTTDQTAKTTIYYTPYIHNIITLWDGADWVPTTFTEKSLALGTVTSGLPYDVFGYLSSGELVLEMLAWTDATTRATAVSLQDGRYCKTGDKTRLLLGTIGTVSTTTTEDSSANRMVSNLYYSVDRNVSYISNDSGHTWTGTAGYRQYNNSSAAKVTVVNSILGIGSFYLTISGINTTATASPAQCWIGVNSTTAPLTGTIAIGTVGTLATSGAASSAVVLPVVGINSINLLERNINAGETMTYSYGALRGVVKC